MSPLHVLLLCGAVMMTSCIITLEGGSCTFALVVECGDIYSMDVS